MMNGGKKRSREKRTSSSQQQNVYPCTRSIVWHSWFTHSLSRYESIVNTHAYNQQLFICLPKSIGYEIATSLKWQSSFYYEIQASITIFLSQEFIQEYIINGSITMIAKNTCIDTQDTVCIVPSGELILLVNKKTKEYLGLIARKYGHALPIICLRSLGKEDQRYLVTIDLKMDVFTSRQDSAYREQIINCLRTTFKPLIMYICAYDKRGVPRTIAFNESDIIDRKRLEINATMEQFKDIYIPCMEQLQSTTSKESDPAHGNRRRMLQGVMDWMGFLSCKLYSRLKQEALEEYISTFSGIQDTLGYESMQEVTTVQWRGLLSTEFCKLIIQKAQEEVKSKRLPWAIVLVWGFPDAIVSWIDEKKGILKPEHGYVMNGTNLYYLILLPEDEYYLVQILGPHDSTV